MLWTLDTTVPTRAGNVAAGSVGDGPPLVLAHGWPWSSYSWHRIIPALAHRHRVHWYDMPGYGRSDKGAGMRTSLDVQSEVFAVMLDHWGLSRPLVVAHDMGGATTLRAHLLHNRDFERYVLLNVVAMRPWGSEFFDHVGRHVDAFTALPMHIHRAVVEAYIRGAIVGELDDEDVEALVAPWLTPKGRESFYRAIRTGRRALHAGDRAVVRGHSMPRADPVGRARSVDPARARARTAPAGTAGLLGGAARHRAPSPTGGAGTRSGSSTGVLRWQLNSTRHRRGWGAAIAAVRRIAGRGSLVPAEQR